MFPGAPSKSDPPPDEHYEVELTPKMRDALLRLLAGNGGITEATLKLIRNQIANARLIDGQLYMARLDWDELEAEAERQGCSAVEIFWDRAGHNG